ncbi:MAG: TIGR03087 family PEP-CTERM/XrtA system glycosyltransferase [Planctomycetes bacterium]|nr:TIGR03087 family PEP-CTERM/XrtA system glycosyltransferase [Planctomycetota bacterium]
MTQRPDLLIVTHRVPHPPDKGDRIRTFHLLKFLAQHAKIHLAALADEPIAEATHRELGALCERVTFAPLGSTRWLRGLGSMLKGDSLSEGVFRTRSLVQTLKKWGDETKFHAALASSSSVARYLWIGNLSKVPAVVDLVDVDSRKWFDYAAMSAFPKSWLYRHEGRRLRRTEQSIASWAEGVTLVSEAEANLFREAVPRSQPRVATNGVDLEYFQPEPEPADVNGCVFVGAFDYRPNVDAAVWFANEIWPNVRKQHPKARFRIVGRRPVRAIRNLSSRDGIEVVGSVPDIRPFLREAAVVVAPLRIARGLQNKVLEALAMGKAVVASPPAMAGFRNDVPAAKAANSREWLDAIDSFLIDRDRRRLAGEKGRRFAEQHHHWERCLEPFRAMLGLIPGKEIGPTRSANAGVFS